MTLSAVLLAGGESRRMGTDKAQLIFKGEPLWQRQLRLLRQLELKEIFISSRDDPAWRPQNVSLVQDEPPSLGPMSGIWAALSRMTASHLCVLAVDMPFVEKADLQRLVNGVRAGGGIVPVSAAGLEPLAAIYPRTSIDHFKDSLLSGNGSMHRLIYYLVKEGTVKLLPLSPAEARRCRSVNTPAELVAFNISR